MHHTDYLWHCSKVSWIYSTGLWLLHLEQKKILQGPFKFTLCSSKCPKSLLLLSFLLTSELHWQTQLFKTPCLVWQGYRAPHLSAGGNSFTSPTSVCDCSPSVNVSLYLIRTFSCKIHTHSHTQTGSFNKLARAHRILAIICDHYIHMA